MFLLKKRISYAPWMIFYITIQNMRTHLPAIDNSSTHKTVRWRRIGQDEDVYT